MLRRENYYIVVHMTNEQIPCFTVKSPWPLSAPLSFSIEVYRRRRLLHTEVMDLVAKVNVEVENSTLGLVRAKGIAARELDLNYADLTAFSDSTLESL